MSESDLLKAIVQAQSRFITEGEADGALDGLLRSIVSWAGADIGALSTAGRCEPLVQVDDGSGAAVPFADLRAGLEERVGIHRESCSGLGGFLAVPIPAMTQDGVPLWLCVGRLDGAFDAGLATALSPAAHSIGHLVAGWDRLKVEHIQAAVCASRMRTFFELSPVGMALNDYSTGQFIDVNEALLAPTGYSRAEFLKLNYWAVTPESYADQEAQQLATMAATGRYGPYTKEYIRKDGGMYPVQLSGFKAIEPDGRAVIWSTVQDITERIRATVALQDEVEHTQAIIDNVLDGVITIDPEGTVHSLNKAASSIFGFSADEVVGQNVKMLMPEPFHCAHDGYLSRYRRTGVAKIIGIGREVEGRRKSGEIFPLELAVSAISRGGQRLYIGLLRDITDRKRVERLKTEFVSTVSHELRTPLTSISGALGLIVDGAVGEVPEPMEALIEISYRNAQVLGRLIDDLLDVEKFASGKARFEFAVQPIGPLVTRALEANQSYADQHGVRFVIEGSELAHPVTVDGLRLVQVLSNLLSNAAKFSPTGGVVQVSITDDDGWVKVAVSDDGDGVPESFRDRIFEKFSQADGSDTRQAGGTGLGLAISKEIIERMDGTLSFESIEGEGATFFFRLPAAGELGGR